MPSTNAEITSPASEMPWCLVRQGQDQDVHWSNTMQCRIAEVTSPVSKMLEFLSEKVGKYGVVAGGAVRDLLLGREPKDYDVFTFDKSFHSDFLHNPKEVTEVEEVRSERKDKYGDVVSSGISIANCLIRDRPVQLIHIPRVTSPEDVLRRFDFTINMAAYYQGRLILPLTAGRAIDERRLNFNCEHHMAFDMNPQRTVQHLIKRAYYLSGKLDLELPMYTVLAIYDKYPYDVDLEFEDRNF